MGDYSHLRSLQSYSKLTSKGVKYVEDVLANPPSRSVGETSLLSVSGGYASRRFPLITEYESAGCEKPYILVSILDRSVVDILSQPSALSIVKHDIKGRRRHDTYTPDYIEFTETKIHLIENKTEATLTKLSASYPDWTKDKTGWRYLPGEVAAHEMGMGFRVFCPDVYPSAYLANLQIIARMPTEACLDTTQSLLEKIKLRLSSRPHTVLELCSLYQGITASVLYQAIVAGELFGLLEHQQLDANFLLYRTLEQAQEHAVFLRASADAPTPVGPLHERLLRCSQQELCYARIARDRYDQRRREKKPKNATDYRDEGKQRKAEEEGAPRLAAFVRKTSERGGVGTPIDEETKKGVINHAKKYLASGKPPNLAKMFADYRIHAEAEGMYVPSPETHRKLIHAKLGPERAAFIAGGKRAFHAARPMIDGGNANPRLCIAGLQVHIDGVYGDVRSAPDEEAIYNRPIFYPLIDDETGYVYARGVKLGRPSMLAVLMAHRHCIQRHGFLPAEIYHDWGPEFVNIHIPEMTAHFEVGYMRRPSGAARFGGVGEMFNAQLSSFLQSLSGGTYFDKAGRSADGKKKSRATADLDIREILHQADRWIFETWNLTPIGDRNKSPAELEAESRKCFPEAYVNVVDDALARYHTSLPLKSEKFTYRRGYRYGATRFSSDAVADLIRKNEKPTGPRLDCMDPSTVRVLTSQGPSALRSMDYKRIQGLDFSQRMDAMRDLLLARSVAKRNQHERATKEAKQLKEMSAIKSVESAVDMDRNGGNEAPTGQIQPDFSSIQSRPSMLRVLSK